MKNPFEDEKLTMVLIVLPFLFILLSLLSVPLIKFRLSFTPAELRVDRFGSEMTDLPLKNSESAYGSLKSPFGLTAVNLLSEDVVGLKSMAPANLKVSVIVISRNRRMAIVNGVAVEEGDKLEALEITKIERERVLITEHSYQSKEAIKKWVVLDGANTDQIHN